ncbi:hypothetical protein ABI59_23730 [Acidobacteria bacterium Mor1]|nr:hypothetical protein ABI59_23730 [Acidobacteria bacterium Mor1]
MLLAAGCGPGEEDAADGVHAYIKAVQDGNFSALRCALAGAAAEGSDPAAFEAWARDLYLQYETGRDQGGVAFDEEGLLLVKTFALGKGTFYSVLQSESSAETLTVDTLVRFGYTQIDYSALSPGTTFYLAGWPPGRIRAMRVPGRADTLRAEVLERIVVRWTLVREPAAGGCPERYSVYRVEPVEDTGERINWAVEWQ